MFIDFATMVLMVTYLLAMQMLRVQVSLVAPFFIMHRWQNWLCAGLQIPLSPYFRDVGSSPILFSILNYGLLIVPNFLDQS